MAEITPPADLIQLKADWYAARALADQIANEPAAPINEDDEADRQSRTVTINPRHAGEQPHDILLPTAEQMARLNEARDKVQRITLEIFRHPWKQQQPDRHKAEKELNRVALERYQATLAGA
jgi:hypothetical protein